MSSSSNPQLKVGCNQDASHSISNLSERVESPFEPPEVDDEDQDEDGDVDFNPFLNEAPSPEASSSLSSEVEVLDVDAVDSDENTIASGGIGSSKLSDEVQGFAVEDSEHEEDEIVMQASDSPGGLCENELEKHMPGKVKKRKSVFFSEPEIKTVQVEENGASSGTDVNNEIGARNLSSMTRYRNPLIDFDDEDAICKRTRARYSLASFTLDELETFLQETDDEDDLQNVDDEEEYKKFLAAVLLGGEGDSQADQENENVDDEDEDNDADFEIEIEEALESDLDENIGEKTEKDEYDEASRRPETRQNKRKKTSGNNQRKHLQLANRPLRPLVPIMPNAPFHPSFDGRSLMPEAAPQCLFSSAEDGFTNGFTPQQIGHLHCLIYEHVQLLIQVFSLCVLDPSRQHIASQVQGLISEMLHKRGQALAWRHVPYPAFWFRHSYIHPLGAAELPKGCPGQCISKSSLTPNAQRDSSSLEMLHLHNTSPSEGRYENVYSEQTGFSQTIGGVSWLPFTGGPLLSILDVAPLKLVESYMDDVKIAVQEYRQRLLEDTCDPRVNKEPLFPLSSFPSFAGASAEVSRGTNPPSADTLPSSSPSHQPPKKTLAATLVESSKKQSVALVPKEIVKLSQRFFPLFNPALFPRKPPLASVANRVLFTDAEDELLAMGLMEYNTDWKAIQQRFLPCKSKHQIFVRQKNRCSSKAPDNPIKAVKRMKNSPLTADEQARIQEGLRIFKHDWMSVWKFIVPHRDPSLLPRQWRIALGTQKSYKIDATKKERRRLYESKRRKNIADMTNWKNVAGKEDCRTEILGENNSGEDSIDNEDEAYVHEAFLADWRPSSSSLRSSELPCISGQLNTGGSGESQPRNNSLKEFPHALMNTGHPYTSSHFTQVRYGAPNTVKPNHLLPDLKSSKTPFYMRPYRARRANNAHLVKLAPDLPPVNLPSSARVISQSAVKSYQCEPSPKVSITGEGIDGVGIEKGVAKLPIITKSRTTNLMEVRRTRTNSPEHNITASHPEESRVFRDKCVTEENGTESDLQMHPLLFRAPDDGHLPYYPLKCSINSPSSFSFFSRSQPEVSLSLFHNPHQADPTVNCSNKSGKSKETKPTSFGVDFHPLLQRTADGNSDSVAACSTAHLSVDLESLRGGFAHLQNSSDANQSESRITCDPSATSTKPYSQKDNEKANDLDLEIHLSSTCRMEKAIGGKLVTQHNSMRSTGRTLNVDTQNTKTPYCGLSATTRSELVDAPVFATTSNNISRCSMGNVGDRCLPEIVMEQEELSDSDEEIGGHVEFECEEMADSEGDDGSDCEQITDTQNKEAPNCTVEKVSKVAGGDDQQCELRAQGDSQGDACIPRKDGTPLTLALTSQGKDIKSCSSWLSLDSCAPGCLPHAKTKHVESIEGKGPDKSCKKMTPRAKRATVPKHEADMPQQLSLGPLAVNPIKKLRKRAGRTNLNLNTEATVESSDCAANDKLG